MSSNITLNILAVSVDPLLATLGVLIAVAVALAAPQTLQGLAAGDSFLQLYTSCMLLIWNVLINIMLVSVPCRNSCRSCVYTHPYHAAWMLKRGHRAWPMF